MSNVIHMQSIAELHAKMGLKKPKHPLISLVHYQDMPMMDLGGEELLYSTDLYHIVLKRCPAQIRYGRTHVDFQDEAMMCTAPQQVMGVTQEMLGDRKQAEGFGLFFHPDLVRRSALGARLHEYSFFGYDANEALHLSESEKQTVHDLFAKIEQEYSQNLDEFSHDVILSNIELLLNYCKRFYGRQFLTRSASNKDVVAKFERWLNEYMHSDNLEHHGMPNVKQCAQAMNLSANYLSDLLRKETGKTTQEHVHLQLIEQAKNLLLGSSKTVSEVAYQLGFEYPQHFSKFFKNKLGVSPSQYRGVH